MTLMLKYEIVVRNPDQTTTTEYIQVSSAGELPASLAQYGDRLESSTEVPNA